MPGELERMIIDSAVTQAGFQAAAARRPFTEAEMVERSDRIIAEVLRRSSAHRTDHVQYRPDCSFCVTEVRKSLGHS